MLDFFQSPVTQTVLIALNQGFLVTLELFFVTLIGALPLGLVIAFGSMNRWTPLSRPHPVGPAPPGAGARPGGPGAHFLPPHQPGHPSAGLDCPGHALILQIIALFYVPGLILEDGSPWPRGEVGRMAAVCVAFIINYAFYFSEIYRGGIQGVPAGQNEAGLVLGMTKRQIFFKVTLLQMVKRIVPPCPTRSSPWSRTPPWPVPLRCRRSSGRLSPL